MNAQTAFTSQNTTNWLLIIQLTPLRRQKPLRLVSTHNRIVKMSPWFIYLPLWWGKQYSLKLQNTPASMSIPFLPMNAGSTKLKDPTSLTRSSVTGSIWKAVVMQLSNLWDALTFWRSQLCGRLGRSWLKLRAEKSCHNTFKMFYLVFFNFNFILLLIISLIMKILLFYRKILGGKLWYPK